MPAYVMHDSLPGRRSEYAGSEGIDGRHRSSIEEANEDDVGLRFPGGILYVEGRSGTLTTFVWDEREAGVA